MKVASPFVVVDNCKDEIEYYRSVLGGEVKILRRLEDKVLNAELHFGTTKITFADSFAAKPTVKGDYVKVILKIETEEEMHRLYNELPVGGRVNVEMYKPPFDGLLAVVTDRNEVGWVLQYVRS